MRVAWIVLTATVNVHPEAAVVIADPALRLCQYQNSLARWLAMAKRDGFRVLLVENSGADLRALRIAMPFDARARLAMLAVDTPPKDVTLRGKGASESAMIDQAMCAIQAQPTEWVAKATGRLFVDNLSRALPRRDEKLSIVMRGTMGGGYVDSRLLIARRATWGTTLKGLAGEVDDPAHLYLEHVIARRVIEAERSAGLIVGRFRRAPQFVGVSGTSGQSYDGSSPLRRILASSIEQALRLIPRDKQF
jgi:hypothetical protein